MVSAMREVSTKFHDRSEHSADFDLSLQHVDAAAFVQEMEEASPVSQKKFSTALPLERSSRSFSSFQKLSMTKSSQSHVQDDISKPNFFDDAEEAGEITRSRTCSIDRSNNSHGLSRRRERSFNNSHTDVSPHSFGCPMESSSGLIRNEAWVSGRERTEEDHSMASNFFIEENEGEYIWACDTDSDRTHQYFALASYVKNLDSSGRDLASQGYLGYPNQQLLEFKGNNELHPPRPSPTRAIGPVYNVGFKGKTQLAKLGDLVARAVAVYEEGVPGLPGLQVTKKQPRLALNRNYDDYCQKAFAEDRNEQNSKQEHRDYNESSNTGTSRLESLRSNSDSDFVWIFNQDEQKVKDFYRSRLPTPSRADGAGYIHGEALMDDEINFSSSEVSEGGDIFYFCTEVAGLAQANFRSFLTSMLIYM